jgi:hypothetical protein
MNPKIMKQNTHYLIIHKITTLFWFFIGEGLLPRFFPNFRVLAPRGDSPWMNIREDPSDGIPLSRGWNVSKVFHLNGACFACSACGSRRSLVSSIDNCIFPCGWGEW